MSAVLISIVIGLIVNECCDVSPWCARKLVRWSAHQRYMDPGRAAGRAEELEALIDARPGKLLKLLTALGFAGSAVVVACRRIPDRSQPPADEKLPQDLSALAVLQALPGRAEFSMMSCTSCEQAIPSAESHLPCPRCGSVDRNVAMADYGTAVDEVTGLDVRFSPAPAAWQEMWAEVRHDLDILRGWYSGGQGMNVTELRAASAAFFVSCYHLTDHIEKDPAVPQPARAQVRSYTNSNSSLKLAADIANTHKHSDRHPGQRPCSLAEASIRPTGAVVTFTWTDAQGKSHLEDCLDLAERAVKAWSAFLRSHNL